MHAIVPEVKPDGNAGQVKDDVSFRQSQASVYLDAARSCAAVLVLLDHWKVIFFVSYASLQRHHSIVALLYLVCGLGKEALIMFFVLSGYLISGSIFRSVERRKWSWRLFLTHRLTRLWVVLLPALFLGMVWDLTGIHMHRAPLLYAGAPFHVTTMSSTITPGIFLGNVFFLQAITVPPLGSSLQLWSLSCEFWYYVLFALAYFACRKVYGPASRMLYAVLLLAGIWFVGPLVLQWFPFWLAGAALAMLPRPTLPRVVRIAALLLYPFVCVGSAIAGNRRGSSPELFGWLFLACSVLFLWTLLSARQKAREGLRVVKFIRMFPRMTYTLYAVHIPLLIFLASLTIGDGKWTPTGRHVAGATGVLAVTLGYAWLVAQAFEFRTHAVRSFFETRLGLVDRSTIRDPAVPASATL
ncbi:MAG TPA: acyltransferase [Acidobacteriaceae bacterium]